MVGARDRVKSCIIESDMIKSDKIKIKTDYSEIFGSQRKSMSELEDKEIRLREEKIKQEEYKRLLRECAELSEKITRYVNKCPVFLLDLICRNEEQNANKSIYEYNKKRFESIVEINSPNLDNLENEFRESRKYGSKSTEYCKGCAIDKHCPYLH